MCDVRTRRQPSKTRPPVDEDSHFVFTVQSKSMLYLGFEAAVFRDPGDELRFNYPADHSLAGEFEQQTIDLERECLREGEYLTVHHPERPGAKDDASDAGALALIAASGADVGEIIVL